MAAKAVFKTIKVEGVTAKAANLLKQTFLAKGGEVAVARGTADLSIERTDVLICATLKQYRLALAQLKAQPWGLPALAKQVEDTLGDELKNHGRVYHWQDRTLTVQPGNTQIMGVIMLDLDSLALGQTNRQAIVKDACKLVNLGAGIIDVKIDSANSCGSMLSASEHLFSLLSDLATNIAVPVSINTAMPSVVRAALAAGVHIAHAACGQKLDVQTAELFAAAGTPVILRYNRAGVTGETELLADILHYWEDSIEIGLKAGMTFDRFTVDLGIGCNMTAEQDMKILSVLSELHSFGCPLLVNTAGLDAAAIVWAISQGAGILRTDDVMTVSALVKTTDLFIRQKEMSLNLEGNR